MFFISSLAVLFCFASVEAGDDAVATDKTASRQDFGEIRNQVETLRGKTFIRPVPVYLISQRELRAISDRDLDKEYPGAKLRSYAELLAWIGIVPHGIDLKSAYGEFFVAQVAGLYDSDSKEMDIPQVSTASTNHEKRVAEKTVQAMAPALDKMVLAHEFTHALEDQYWAIDDPRDHDTQASTDRGTAHDCLSEGSATRVMIEAIPGQWAPRAPTGYFLLWNLIRSGTGEWILGHEIGHSWKSPDALVPGVPDALARSEALPYAFGYQFCAEVLRQWGLDGLDYVEEHPPVSSAQVMHPSKYWTWRDFPVRIDLPEIFPGGWLQVSSDSVGEAGMAVLFGCQFQNLNYGLEVARGWDGDHVALFQDSDRHRLLAWASSWDSPLAAGRYAEAWVKSRHPSTTRHKGSRIEWRCADGRAGFLQRDGKHVILVETDRDKALNPLETSLGKVVFAEPAEDAVRTAANRPWHRFNPFWSWQKDGDYTISRSLGGLLTRHDQNGFGTADRVLLGLVAESRRTCSFQKWQLGGGLITRHESDVRRGTSRTTWLPWGVLVSHSSAHLPPSPDRTITRTSILWGLAGSATEDAAGGHFVHLFPFGLLFRHEIGPSHSALQVLGTGVSKQEGIERFRLFGIPIWTSRAAATGRHI
jgi:hypothetical protein